MGSGSAGLARRNSLPAASVGCFRSRPRTSGHQNTNSQFFQPNNKAPRGFGLSYVPKPLMQGRGIVYNAVVDCVGDDSILDRRKTNFHVNLQSQLARSHASLLALYLERGRLGSDSAVRSTAAARFSRCLTSPCSVSIVVGSQLARVALRSRTRRAELVCEPRWPLRNAQDRIQVSVNGSCVRDVD